MQRLYKFILNPKYDNFVENISYHNRALSIILYIAFRIRTYSTFFHFSYVTIFCIPGSLHT